jgi:hypothetical protein
MSKSTTNYGLKKPLETDFISPDDFNDDMDIIDTQLKANKDLADSKCNKMSIITEDMLATGWNNSEYSFEAEFPVASYDIEIEPAGTITSAQLKVWQKANIVGSATSNVVTAIGTVPTINIPIMVKKVAK